MEKKYTSEIEIPQGIECELNGAVLACKKDSHRLERKVQISETKLSIQNGKVKFECRKANKKRISSIHSFMAHVKNMFEGLDKRFAYEMEICNVHFPMTVKVEGNKLVINNFLGEKDKRFANISSGVEVDVKGQKIIVSSNDIEKAGQTAANIEQATKIAKRDRRVFQDGIFITSKCGVAI